jgi:hypothetical protein
MNQQQLVGLLALDLFVFFPTATVVDASEAETVLIDDEDDDIGCCEYYLLGRQQKNYGKMLRG